MRNRLLLSAGVRGERGGASLLSAHRLWCMECVHDEEDSDYGSDWAGFSLTHLRPETFLQNLLSYGGETSIKNGMTHAFVKGTVSSSCAVERSPHWLLPLPALLCET